ncbi:caspase, EACC1-associated type [Dactylosporangium salmoneum]|uniref:caspase, EACC1-associated type n=1 Tax=Dactylosporangium salmoneum TaxID=53361 RepID=UPI0031DFDAA8
MLVGTWTYHDELLHDIPAAQHSLARMRELLTSDLCGWSPDQVTVFANARKPNDLPDQLVELFGATTDVALFYYVGHGQVDDEDQLCLGLVESLSRAERRGTTSLPFAAVRSALLKSRARTKIVLLDCCFSGLATRPDGSLANDQDVIAYAGVAGAYTMAASGAYTTAWYELEGVGRRPPQTYFTKCLADVIERGIPGEPAVLRLNTIFIHVADKLARLKKPRPTRRSSDFADQFAFARNAAPLESQYDPAEEVKQLRRRLAEAETQLQAKDVEHRRLAERLASMHQDVRAFGPDKAVAADAVDTELNQQLRLARADIDRIADTAADSSIRRALEPIRRSLAEPHRGPAVDPGPTTLYVMPTAAVVTPPVAVDPPPAEAPRPGRHRSAGPLAVSLIAALTLTFGAMWFFLFAGLYRVASSQLPEVIGSIGAILSIASMCAALMGVEPRARTVNYDQFGSLLPLVAGGGPAAAVVALLYTLALWGLSPLAYRLAATRPRTAQAVVAATVVLVAAATLSIRTWWDAPYAPGTCVHLDDRFVSSQRTSCSGGDTTTVLAVLYDDTPAACPTTATGSFSDDFYPVVVCLARNR